MLAKHNSSDFHPIFNTLVSLKPIKLLVILLSILALIGAADLLTVMLTVRLTFMLNFQAWHSQANIDQDSK